ncbi:MAG: uroporphyrinogen-III synthase [Terriglobales bacterium]|jgi:uroporphyrinogen-III synthase
MPSDFAGLCVLSLESRRAQEIAKLIANSGGQPLVVSSVREVPLASNREALDFASQLAEGRIDMVIFMTGVGVRLLLRIVETAYPVEKFVAALSKIPVIARGPKPSAALRDLKVPIAAIVPEPNTWRELLTVFDQQPALLPLDQRRVALQEYGVANPELMVGLKQRGAVVISVPVYEWALPDDKGPLRDTIETIVRGEVDVFLVTAAVQIRHLFAVAEEMGLGVKLGAALSRVFIGSIGPMTTEELVRHGLSATMEPSHPKMGVLVKEASEQAAGVLRGKK